MKRKGLATISARLTFVYTAVFFTVLLLLTLSTYLGVDFFLNRQARDGVIKTRDALTRNINDAVETSQEEQETNDGDEDDIRKEPVVSLDDDEINSINNEIWTNNNTTMGAGVDATLYDATGKVLGSTLLTNSIQISYLQEPGTIFNYHFAEDDRIVLNSVLTINKHEYYLQVTKNMEDETDFLQTLLMALVFADLIGLALAFLTGTLVSRRMLKPIDAITHAARQISTKDLHQRIPVQSPEDELSRLSSTINEMLERLEISFEKQNRFVSDASHELRTPIQVIQGYSDLLNRWGKADPAVLDESVEAIRKESHSMRELVENLLFLARTDGSIPDGNIEEFDMSELVREVMKESVLIDSRHTLETTIDSGIRIQADRKMMKQMLRALLDNSFKYTPEGGRIQIALTRLGNDANIRISDNGIGIPKEQLPFIFDRFYRVDEARTKESGGTGLGLSIVKWIVDFHGGNIKVESEPGQGTIIKVDIPQKSVKINNNEGIVTV